MALVVGIGLCRTARSWSWASACVGIASATLIVACGNDRRVSGSALTCGAGPATALSDSGVGALRISAHVEDLKRQCLVLTDTQLASGNEGMPERRLTVVVRSVSTTATIVGDRVWRIEIASPRFRTLDSLGVGSTVRQLRQSPARLAMGERGAYLVRSDHCGLSFQLPQQRDRPYQSLAAIPDSTKVNLILVVGC